MIALILAACTGPDDTDPTGIGIYYVDVETTPSPPRAGEPSEVTLAVIGPDGTPVDDLTETHERMVHTFVISRDLASFAHVHHEDFAPITGENLKSATFHWPHTFANSGDFFLSFEFANAGEYRRWGEWLTVTGDPPQATPDLAAKSVSTSRELTAALVWDVPPTAGQQAAFHLDLSDADGPVDDVVPYLGTDGHAAIVSADFVSVGHTHAWVEGMDEMPPGHQMPHLYDGPELPFRYVFPQAGPYRTWIQFARAAAPDVPYTVDFTFEVP